MTSVALVGESSEAAGLPPCAAVTFRFLHTSNRQLTYRVKIRFISQLINGMLSALQKLLKCFNGAIISSSFVPILVAS